jgi:hypothetical protein
MLKKIGRREFMARGAKAGLASVLAGEFLANMPGGVWAAPAAAGPDIAVAAGTDHGAAAVKAVETLGGMARFVKKGAKVALLPNVQSRHPGTFTKPEIFRAVIRMCREAGAGEIAALSLLTQQHSEGSGLGQVAGEEGIEMKLIPAEESLYRTVPIPGAAAFQEARVPNEFYAYDAYINMPITKDHAGNRFTGTLKNRSDGPGRTPQAPEGHRRARPGGGRRLFRDRPGPRAAGDPVHSVGRRKRTGRDRP